MESDPQENTPLKYMQVSVDAIRVITQDPEQSECAYQEPFIPACSDMKRDNSEIPTSAVPTSTQILVVLRRSQLGLAPNPETKKSYITLQPYNNYKDETTTNATYNDQTPTDTILTAQSWFQNFDNFLRTDTRLYRLTATVGSDVDSGSWTN
ncbi:hypothetical protein ElyMa_004390700 [Elysia marginata]|uniref:Uncharacterized protein n=1 Tax=Elysia marginata TaxID=1093978 RepID=A0AAV4H6U8_9GAST|nr:hypothetical protein ElyMa_004390700 [Elysia marginata]